MQARSSTRPSAHVAIKWWHSVTDRLYFRSFTESGVHRGLLRMPHRSHRRPPELGWRRRPPELPLCKELANQRTVIYHRTAARDAASEQCRARAREAAQHRPPPPLMSASIPKQRHPTLLQGISRPPSAELLQRQSQAAGGRSSWGFFACQRELDVNTREALLRIEPPDVMGCDGLSRESISIVRPCTSDVLAYGPFAFKLSPSSEVCAWLVSATHYASSLRGKAVLEVGAGLGYSGIACAAWSTPESVLLTDGDPTSVAALRRNVEVNAAALAFGQTRVQVRQLRYGDGLYCEGSERQPALFDCILCADCVYDREYHLPLCSTLKRSLHRDGHVIVVASRRCGSLDDFMRCCMASFVVETIRPLGAVEARFRNQKCFPRVLILRHSPGAPYPQAKVRLMHKSMSTM